MNFLSQYLEALFMVISFGKVIGTSKACKGTFIFIRTPNFRWSGQFIAIRTDLSKTQCMSACVAHPDCNAIQYWINFNRCEMLPAPFAQGGDLIQESSDNVSHYQTICLRHFDPMTVCSESFTRWPQKALIGFAELVRNGQSLSQCLSACMDRLSCKSVMYFYNNRQCVLNGVNQETAKELFTDIDTKQETVDYFQPNCLGDWTKWSQWGQCAANSYRSRSRTCSVQSTCKGKTSESERCYLPVINENRGLDIQQEKFEGNFAYLPADLQPNLHDLFKDEEDIAAQLPTPPPFSNFTTSSLQPETTQAIPASKVDSYDYFSASDGIYTEELDDADKTPGDLSRLPQEYETFFDDIDHESADSSFSELGDWEISSTSTTLPAAISDWLDKPPLENQPTTTASIGSATSLWVSLPPQTANPYKETVTTTSRTVSEENFINFEATPLAFEAEFKGSPNNDWFHPEFKDSTPLNFDVSFERQNSFPHFESSPFANPKEVDRSQPDALLSHTSSHHNFHNPDNDASTGTVPLFVKVVRVTESPSPPPVSIDLPTNPPTTVTETGQISATPNPHYHTTSSPISRTGNLVIKDPQDWNLAKYKRHMCKNFRDRGYSKYGDCLKSFHQFIPVEPAKTYRGGS